MLWLLFRGRVRRDNLRHAIDLLARASRSGIRLLPVLQMRESMAPTRGAVKLIFEG
jgi:hypothetical protein